MKFSLIDRLWGVIGLTSFKRPLYWKARRALGRRIWTRNGKIHRDNGPAVECDDGKKFWYQRDDFHREDGPAWELVGDNSMPVRYFRGVLTSLPIESRHDDRGFTLLRDRRP